MVSFPDIINVLCVVLETDRETILGRKRNHIPFRRTILISVLLDCGYTCSKIQNLLDISSRGTISNMRDDHISKMRDASNNQLYVNSFNRIKIIIYEYEKAEGCTV